MTEVTPPASDGHRALKTPAISFEFFPPKTEEMERSLWETIKRLAPLTPSFVSVTYGAGGSTRERTHSTIARILTETELLPAAHLTCVGAARGEIDQIVGRHHADAQFQAGPQLRHPRRHHGAGLARGKVRRPRRRSRHPQAGGGNRCRGPGAEARQARRRHLPFLHHEPRRPGVCDQPSAR